MKQNVRKGEVSALVGMMLAMCFFLWLAVAAGAAEEKPCGWEEAQVIAICRVLGPKTPECIKAKQDLEVCLLENVDDDPIGGVE